MPPRGKLSRAEVQLAVDKIVKKYDEYAIRFFKTPSLKVAFEERYFSALKGGLDMQRFLQAEIDVVDELIRKAEAQLQQAQASQGAAPRAGFADRVIAELSARTEKYGEVPFHRHARQETRRLVAALGRFERELMSQMHDALRETSYGLSSREMADLDSRLRDLASPDGKSAPPRLTRYAALLNAFPRDYNAVDREEKSFLVDAAYLLHDVHAVIERARESYRDLAPEDLSRLEQVDGYVLAVLEDFRIKDFRRPGP